MQSLIKYFANMAEIDSSTITLVFMATSALMFFIREHLPNALVGILAVPLISGISLIFVELFFHVLELPNDNKLGQWLFWLVLSITCGASLGLGAISVIARASEDWISGKHKVRQKA